MLWGREEGGGSLPAAPLFCSGAKGEQGQGVPRALPWVWGMGLTGGPKERDGLGSEEAPPADTSRAQVVGRAFGTAGGQRAPPGKLALGLVPKAWQPMNPDSEPLGQDRARSSPAGWGWGGDCPLTPRQPSPQAGALGLELETQGPGSSPVCGCDYVNHTIKWVGGLPWVLSCETERERAGCVCVCVCGRVWIAKNKKGKRKKKRKREKEPPRAPQVSCHKWVLKRHPYFGGGSNFECGNKGPAS